MTSPDEAGGSPPATLTPTGWEPPVPEGAPTPATPRLPAGLHATLQGHLVPGATPAYVHQDVLTEIARHGRNALGRAGGLLLGSRHGVGPEIVQYREVLPEVALEGEDTDPGLTSHARRGGAAQGGRRR